MPFKKLPKKFVPIIRINLLYHLRKFF